MNKQICRLAAVVRLDRQAVTGATGLSYRRQVAGSRALFATPPVDLQTLVIAEAIKRKAQAELQREALRDVAYAYEMPVSPERNRDWGARIHPVHSDE